MNNSINQNSNEIKKDILQNSNNDESESIINNSSFSGFGVIIISIISALYILLATKLAEIISINEKNDETQIGTYVMIIYFISIVGIICSFIWFKSERLPDWIIKWSLSIGGVIMLIYTIINYWDFLSDYSKLILIFLSIICIIYYLYRYY